MSATPLTKTAREALAACARGGYPGSPQMARRLAADELIDFYPGHGWFVTEAGHAALGESA